MATFSGPSFAVSWTTLFAIDATWPRAGTLDGSLDGGAALEVGAPDDAAALEDCELDDVADPEFDEPQAANGIATAINATGTTLHRAGRHTKLSSVMGRA